MTIFLFFDKGLYEITVEATIADTLNKQLVISPKEVKLETKETDTETKELTL